MNFTIIVIIGIGPKQIWMNTVQAIHSFTYFDIDLLHSIILFIIIIIFFFLCRFLLVVVEENSVYY